MFLKLCMLIQEVFVYIYDLNQWKVTDYTQHSTLHVFYKIFGIKR